MPFRFPAEGDRWFSKLNGEVPFRYKFDFYYLCMMLGLASGRREDVSGTEFIDYFIDEYKNAKRLIGGLLVLTEMKRLNIDLSEKKDVRRLIADLFDSTSPTGLSEYGIKQLNSYASGGFASLSESREQPYNSDEFLSDYVERIDRAIEESRLWSNKASRVHDNGPR